MAGLAWGMVAGNRLRWTGDCSVNSEGLTPVMTLNRISARMQRFIEQGALTSVTETVC